MSFLKIEPAGRTVEFVPGASLMDLLLKAEVFIDNACGGKGICGKCRVRILEGDAGSVTDTEKTLLYSAETEAGIRLACRVFPSSDITAETLQKERKHDVLTSGYLPDFEFDRDIRAEYGAASERIYGVAVDIGTTTVVCSLVDMMTGEVMYTASGINAQKQFGLDVLTRITYEMEHPEDGADKLQRAIVGSINVMVKTVCESCGAAPDEVYEFTVSANCTMMHMLLGVDATPMGRSPYTPVFTSAQDVRAADIGLRCAAEARLYCLPSVSAYIGADIVAGAYVCDLRHEQGNVMFIDIGTNGEIVLAGKGRLLCCSCAAGPALEGMNISSGMRAAEGAIEDIAITENGIVLKVIGDAAPSGICGSGILTAVKELLRTGIVRNTGAFVRADKFSADDYRFRYIEIDEGGRRSFRLTEGGETLHITQNDIRQVQLAKGAILSGFTALMRRAGIGIEDLDRILIAGQFGAHLPADSITGTGILPFEAEDRIEYAGNTSMTGAYMALMSRQVRREMGELSEEMESVELGMTENYEMLLAECLVFPDFK